MEESVSIEIQTPMQNFFYIWFLSVNQYYKSGHCATILVSQTWSERGRFELIQFWISYDGVVVFVMKFSTFFKLLKLAMDILHCKNEIFFFLIIFFHFFFRLLPRTALYCLWKWGESVVNKKQKQMKQWQWNPWQLMKHLLLSMIWRKMESKMVPNWTQCPPKNTWLNLR